MGEELSCNSGSYCAKIETRRDYFVENVRINQNARQVQCHLTFHHQAIMILILVPICFLISVVVLGILYLKRHSPNNAHNQRDVKNPKTSVRICIVMGSGGHTTEMLSVIKHLGKHYSHRTYIIAETDRLSEDKVLNFEQSRDDGSFEVIRIGRSREVLQSYFTAIFSTLRSLLHSAWIVWQQSPDVVLCNGPGTCIPICLMAAAYDFLRLSDIRIFFIESVCRVKRLSLSALILYHLRIPDLIAVRWRDLAIKYPRTKFVEDL